MKTTTTAFIFILNLLTYNLAYAQQCSKEEDKAKEACSEEKFTAYKKELADVNKQLAGRGVGEQAQTGIDKLSIQKQGLDAQIAACEKSRNGCAKACTSDAQQKRQQTPPQETAAQQDDKKKQNCESGEPKKAEENAKGTSDGMAQAMQALAGLLAALGAGGETPETPEQPLCTTNPNDPTCKTDTASNDSGSTLTSGEFRRDAGAAFADGELGAEAAPVAGAPAAVTMSAPMAGGAAPNLGGGGGGGGGRGGGSSKEKKSEFDGSPKINLASGFGGGGGGGGKSGGGGGSGGKSSANPTAGRTGIDGDQNAGKVAQAAEDRLRGPASNEPLGGISSVYYLDNFTKVEKRIMNERNTLQEH